MAFLNKYGVARHIYIPIVKRAVVDFAVSADWTPAAGDVKISKDGGAAANVTNLPTAITMGNGAMWDFSLTATEMQAAQVVITVVDAATKAVEDQSFIIETYGNASAEHPFDLATATQSVSVAQWNGTNVSAPATAGIPEVNVKNVNNVSAASVTTVNANQGTTQPVNFTGTAGSALVKSDAVDIAGSAVATGSAQLGVNVVNIAGSAAALDANNLLKVDAEDWKGGVIPAPNVTGVPLTDLKYTLGTISPATAGSVRADQVTGAVGSVAAGVTVTTNNDKTGYSLSQAFPTNFSSFAIDASGRIDLSKILGSAINALISGRVDADVTNDLATKTYAESAAVPAATASLKDKIVWLATVARNKITQTSTTQKVRNDGDAADVATSTVSDDGTTFTRGKFS